MCNSLLLPGKAEVVALGGFGCGGKLGRLLLGHVQAPVADLLGAEPLVRLQHRLGRCIVLETQAQENALFKLCTVSLGYGRRTDRSKHFTFHPNTPARTRCDHRARPLEFHFIS